MHERDRTSVEPGRAREAGEEAHTTHADAAMVIQEALRASLALASSPALGWAGPAIFAALYVLATTLLLPASLLTLAAGFLYGTALGTALVSLSSTASACLSFALARSARPLALSLLAGTDLLRRMEAASGAMSQEGWRVVLLWRASPLFPFGLSNYLFGLSSIPFLEYAVASWLGMLPATLAYVSLGASARATLEATLHSPARSGSLGHSTTVHDSLEVGSSTAAYGTVPHSGRHTMASEMQYSAKLNALRGARLSPQARAVLYIVGSVATILAAREIAQRATMALQAASSPV